MQSRALALATLRCLPPLQAEVKAMKASEPVKQEEASSPFGGFSAPAIPKFDAPDTSAFKARAFSPRSPHPP